MRARATARKPAVRRATAPCTGLRAATATRAPARARARLDPPMEDTVRVELARVVLQQKGEQQYVYLRVPDTQRKFPIVIGFYEAAEIHRKLRGERSERPLTHDLIGRLLGATEWHVDRVVVSALTNSTFFANLVITHDNEERAVDCRPSDAIALAVQTNAPIYVAREVLDEVCPGEVT